MAENNEDAVKAPAKKAPAAKAPAAKAPAAKPAAKPAAAPYADPNDARPTRGRPRKKVTEMPTAVPEPSLFARGNGTYGPAPVIAPRPATAPARPIPWNLAFREVLAFVTTELKDAGEQWTDQAKQDMVSTVLISASNSGLLSLWER